MTVYFIGAGPGAPDLLTLRAIERIKYSQTILYAGSLIPLENFQDYNHGAKLINTADLSLDEIIEHIKMAHEKGYDIARLHSGDLSIYSAITEQIARLDALNIPYELVPGVAAFSAATSAFQIELTKAGIAQSVILTRPGKKASKIPEAEQLENLAKTKATLVIHLGAKSGAYISETLIPFYGKTCPCFIASFVSQDKEQLIKTTLDELPAALKKHGITRTALIFVGRALTEQGQNSKLYDEGYKNPK